MQDRMIIYFKNILNFWCSYLEYLLYFSILISVSETPGEEADAWLASPLPPPAFVLSNSISFPLF
jgi:hypothetical protein